MSNIEEILVSDEMSFLFTEIARLHGEDAYPDHEVGDLQDVLCACWSVMTPEQRALAVSDRKVNDMIFSLDGKSVLSPWGDL